MTVRALVRAFVSELRRALSRQAETKPYGDFVGYAHAVYRPSPALSALAEVDPFWATLGGDLADPWGDAGETLRQRQTAYGHTAPGGWR